MASQQWWLLWYNVNCSQVNLEKSFCPKIHISGDVLGGSASFSDNIFLETTFVSGKARILLSLLFVSLFYGITAHSFLHSFQFVYYKPQHLGSVPVVGACSLRAALVLLSRDVYRAQGSL